MYIKLPRIKKRMHKYHMPRKDKLKESVIAKTELRKL